MLNVCVIGARGRMGAETCRAVQDAPDMDLSAMITSADGAQGIARTKADVAVEFSTPSTVFENTLAAIGAGMHVVVGATGLTDEQLTQLDHDARSASVGLFVAPNFALGAVLMMRFAAEAAPYFQRAEIVERHHEGKLDAPSGTSLRTASLMNAARSEPWAPLDDRGSSATGEDHDGIRIHSLRMPGLVAHQEVVLGAPGETLSIRHDSLDRVSFMPGVLLAIRKVGSLTGLTVGLENILDR
jgi:4-hydroxy-tetrahydrodipicolinate reductase